MRRFYIIGFLFLLAFDTMSQVSFKMAAMTCFPPELDFSWLQRLLSEHWIYLSVLGYIGSFISYMTLLKHAPIGPAFAATHMEVVTVLLISVFFLKETLTVWEILGSVLIVAGILVLALAEEETELKESHAA